MPNVQKTWMQRVRIPTELPFLHATVGGWVSITKKRTELPFLHATIGLLGGDPTGQHLRTGPGITNKHLLFFFLEEKKGTGKFTPPSSSQFRLYQFTQPIMVSLWARSRWRQQW